MARTGIRVWRVALASGIALAAAACGGGDVPEPARRVVTAVARDAEAPSEDATPEPGVADVAVAAEPDSDAVAALPELPRFAGTDPSLRRFRSTADLREWLTQLAARRDAEDERRRLAEERARRAEEERRRAAAERRLREKGRTVRIPQAQHAREAGVLGVLSAESAFGSDTALGNDPMSAAGALMGDQIGESFGFGGLGLRGTGRGGGGPGAGGAEESITHNQVEGVDEGDIVKAHGDHLVVLRRGRLFSIDLSVGRLRAVSRVDVPPPNSGGGWYGSWYDEMLIHGDTIAVIGFSYESRGTEVALFDIDQSGVIRPRLRFHLRSNDYYSSRNYASRLIGRRLIFYMPYRLFEHEHRGGSMARQVTLPAMRLEADGRGANSWREIVIGSEVFRPVHAIDDPTLHTIVVCDLGSPRVPCRARGIVGGGGRSFFVSMGAVYVWTGDAARGSMLYRMPLDGSAVGALRTDGMPIDQLSFQEAPGGSRVLLNRNDHGGGDWLFAAEHTSGGVGLGVVRIPLSWFTDRVGTVPDAAYTTVPPVGRGSVQNRWVGDHVLYGSGGGWHGPGESAERRVHVHDVARRSSRSLALPHGVDRIEPMGGSAVAVGSDGHDLFFTSIALDASEPRIVDQHVQLGATQGETRSHGFFYRPFAEDHGVLGLPLRSGEAAGWRQLAEGLASVLFLEVDQDRFETLGVLGAHAGAGANDACRVSCMDWYGNARPIFWRGRVLALMGYELVEGRLAGGALEEVRRTTFLRP